MHPRTEYIQSGVVRRLDVLETLTYQGNVVIPTGDTTVKVSAADTTTGFLQSKIAAGSGISLSIANPGANEQLTISANVVTTDELTKVSANDTTAGYLNGKLVAGTGITLTENNNGGNETLTVASSVVNTDEVVKVSSNDTTAGFLNGKLVAGTNITFTENNNGSNETLTIAASGLTGFTASQNTASPNNTVNASRLLVDATSTDADAVIQPKGTGALLAQLPDGTATGGNKRGANALDLQTLRTANSNVASGTGSVTIGSYNTASGTEATAIGRGNVASGNNATAIGIANTASGTDTTAIGRGNNASANNSITIGNGCSSIGTGGVSIGHSCAVNGLRGVAMGNQCSAGQNSFSVGVYNIAGSQSLAAGESCVASGFYSAAFGQENTASAYFAFATGAQSSASNYGQRAHASGRFASNGDCQYERYIIRRATTDATPAELSCNGAAPGATTRIGIANDSTYSFTALVTARRTDADNESAGYKIEGVIDNNAGTTAFVGTPTVTVLAEDTAAWDVVVEADNTNDALVIKVTGETGKTIRWGAVVELMKVSG